MPSVTLTLPWPPTTNTAYATVNGRRVKSRAARAYATLAEEIARLKHPIKPFNTHDRLRVLIQLRPPNRRAFDIANREKILIDAIAPHLGFDDQQIDELTIHRLEPADQPHQSSAIVTITRNEPTSSDSST